MHTHDDVTNTPDSGLVEQPTDEPAEGPATHETIAEGDVTVPLAAERARTRMWARFKAGGS